jgi:hypothetical protein
MAFQLRRGLDAERTAGGGIVFAEGELVYITDTEEVYVGDGVTPGGIRVTGNVTTSPEALTRNLSLGGFDINGTGNININGTISASNITGGGGGGLIEGQEYTIDIIGDVKAPDSGLIVDSTNSIVYADFVGDGSLISNISLDQLADVDTTGVTVDSVLKYDGANWVVGTDTGAVAPFVGDLTGSVFADDSTLVVNGQNGDISTGRINQTSDAFSIQPTSGNENLFEIFSSVEDTLLQAIITSDSDLSGTNARHGRLLFSRRDSQGVTNIGGLSSRENGLYLFHSASGVHPDATAVTLTEGTLGVGTYTPNTDYVFDVRGDTTVSGSIAIANGSIRFTDGRAITDITDATIGDLKYEPNEDSFVFYNSTSSWHKVVATNLTTKLTDFDAGIRLTSNTQLELDQLLEDSTFATGVIAYNEDEERFDFFQAGSWVKLPNNGNNIGEVLTWNGTQWSASAPASGGNVVNADQLGNQLPAFYLNWTNFTNTPTTIAGYGITDAVVDFADLGTTPTTIAGYGITDAVVDFADLGTTPTTLVGYGITDAATSAQGSLADSAVQPADLGNFTFTASVLDSSDSSGITITPAVVMSSDLTVENNLTVTNTLVVDTIEVNNLITAAGAGTPEISSETDILLTAADRVEITSSPLKMASFTTAERDAIVAENGDIIYNTTDNKFQGYENGAWANLI